MLKGINNNSFINFKQTTDNKNPNTSYVAKPKSAPQDTVEISRGKSGGKLGGKWSKLEEKWDKWGKYAAGLGAIVLATVGVIVGRKTINAKRAEKIAAEARKLEEEARLRAEKKAEEARIKAEQRAKAEAERQAQIKAQKEAEAKAKAEAEERTKIETQRIAEANAKKERQIHNQKLINEFSSTNYWDLFFFNMNKYGKEGIPLKYSRDSFLTDIKTEFDKLNPEESKKIQQKFNLKLNKTSFNSVGVEIEGIPKIPEKLETESEKNIAKIIRNFTEENETTFENPEMKELYDSIIQTIPEFTSVVGKKQHGTHKYSVDIHTLMNLNDNLRNIKMRGLDEESQKVLKYSTILHDLGKNFIADGIPDSGHALRSVEIAKPILERLDLSEQTKKRILKQIKNHHWFKDYNQGITSPEQVVAKFETTQDFTIAEIMAKSDLKNVSDTFHYGCLDTTPELYPEKLAEKFAPIKKLFFDGIAEAKGLKPDRHGIRPISCEEEYYDVLSRLQHLEFRKIYTNNGQVTNEFTHNVFGSVFYPRRIDPNNLTKEIRVNPFHTGTGSTYYVPNKMEGLLAYVGVCSDGNGHFRMYELYNDLNRFLSKKADIKMEQVPTDTLLYSSEGKKLLEDHLVNINSEEAKDLIRCVDFSLKELDKKYGKFEGIVYRNGHFSSDGGQYWSTSFGSDLHCVGEDSAYHVIKTKNGHKIDRFNMDYYNGMHEREREVLLQRGSKYREVTGFQYEEQRRNMAKDRYEYFKSLDEEFYTSKGQPPKYNYSFEDILAKTHVWEEI